ncbi:MAG: FAD-dependent oxidoreductase [Flavobacteriaceae bacterium]|nr:FAD-dependent oxidoreductase [Flavobacteriaceae bacterium]
MKELDYIVVGLGISGISICEQLEKNNKRFVVFNKGNYISTIVSAGLINPVVLKRFTPVWNASEHINTSTLFYKTLSEKLDIPLFEDMPMLRIFKSNEEQNNWMVASDKNDLSSFLHPEILKNENQNINAPFGFGKVKSTGKIDTVLLINSYKKHLEKSNCLINESFNYKQLQQEDNHIFYNNYIANKIIFSEGYAVKDNPYFPKEIINNKNLSEKLILPNKGEYIIVESPELQLNTMLKTSLFIIPLGDNLYKVGATYDREDESTNTTNNAKKELVIKLKTIINCPFEVVDQVAGIRPTTRDRRPFLGTLKESKNIIFYNGLGTRGITSAPSLAELLYQHIENNKSLPNDVDIKRHYKW